MKEIKNLLERYEIEIDRELESGERYECDCEKFQVLWDDSIDNIYLVTFSEYAVEIRFASIEEEGNPVVKLSGVWLIDTINSTLTRTLKLEDREGNFIFLECESKMICSEERGENGVWGAD